MKVTHSRCQCRECGQYFNSVAAFDKHRVGGYEGKKLAKDGPRRCLSESEMIAAKMSKNVDGYWITALAYGNAWW